jgi:hypothetical protein
MWYNGENYGGAKMKLSFSEWELFGIFFYGILAGIAIGIVIGAFILEVH